MVHSDLPGHIHEQYEAERRALRAAERVLVAAGCKVVEVPASFDDGLDLFIALTRDRSVEPFMAAVQVKGGSSHRRRIPVKAHRAYWREHTLPVFGVVHDGERGYWADLTAALKGDANLASVSTSQPLDASFPAAVRDACIRQHATRDLLDLMDNDASRQTTAVVAARSLPNDPRVARLLRVALTQLHRPATSLALEHLARLNPKILANEPFDAALLGVLLTRLWAWDTDDFHEPGLPAIGTTEAARATMRHLYDCLTPQLDACAHLAQVYATAIDPEIAYLSAHLMAAQYSGRNMPLDEARRTLTSVARWRDRFEIVELLSVMDEGRIEFDIN